MMKKRKPWLSGLLNAIIPGLGYIYNGKRKFLGYFLTFGIIIGMSADYYYNFESTAITSIYHWIGGLMIYAAFIYDAYSEAKNLNEQK